MRISEKEMQRRSFRNRRMEVKSGYKYLGTNISYYLLFNKYFTAIAAIRQNMAGRVTNWIHSLYRVFSIKCTKLQEVRL